MRRKVAYSEKQKTEILDKVFKLMAEEGKSLRKAVATLNGVDRSTVYAWIEKDEAKSDQYARAIIERAEYWSDEMIDIADGEESKQDDSVSIQRDKLKVDTRKWLMSKMYPKKYGNQLKLQGDEENPVQIEQIIGMKVT